MPPRLIVNADDFGLTPGINQAIIELHQAGAVSSATLMATGPAFADAVSLARANPTLGVGCHIVLVDGTPASDPDAISTLLGPDGHHFRPTLATFVRDLFLGRIEESEIELEASAQMERLQGEGVRVTHLDTHKHTHIFPQVSRPLWRIANEACMSIRNPFEPAFSRRASHPPRVRAAQLCVLERFRPIFNGLTADTAKTDGTLGIAATGNMDASALLRIFNALPSHGTYELCCHPGYNDRDLETITTRLRVHRQIERKALLAIIPQIFSLPNAPELIHYGDL